MTGCFTTGLLEPAEDSDDPSGSSSAPTVALVSPSSGPASGNYTVTIKGSRFASGARVVFGSAQASSVTVVNAEEIEAVVPPGSGTVEVKVTNDDGVSGSLANGFQYQAAPSITGLSPASGPTAGGTVVTLSGANFQSGATVTFGGTAATGVSFVSASQLKATSPVKPAGTVAVEVRNPDGQTASHNGFTYEQTLAAAPSISGISPTSGTTAGGTAVTISGADFQPEATVTFGGTAAWSVSFVGSSQLTAVTPSLPAGTVDVQVRNPDGQSATHNGFTYTEPTTSTALALNSISPASGPLSGGTLVTLNGSGFQSGATVKFGTLLATGVSLVSSSQMTAISPAVASAGTVSVEVQNPDGAKATLASAFSYTSDSQVQGVLFEDDFETCDFSKYSDKAGNSIERSIARSGQCSARTGAGSNGYGKLMVHLLDGSGVQQSYDELWLRGWVYFHPNYPVPCCGDVLISPHLWRFHEPDWRFERDFSTNQGQDTVRDFYFWKVSGGTPEAVRYYDSNFHFASADRRGRWQCWEIRTKLNTPGAADGISEFYADGVLIGRHEGLNIRGNTTYGYGKVDVQSNIAKPTDAAMPPDMWWLVDDVVISTERPGCGTSSTDTVLARGSETGTATVLADDFESGDWSKWAGSTLFLSNQQAASGSFSARAEHRAGLVSAEAAEAFFGDYLNQGASVSEVSASFDVWIDHNAELAAAPCAVQLGQLVANDDGRPLYGGALPYAPYYLNLCLNSALEPVVVQHRNVDGAYWQALAQNQGSTRKQAAAGQWQQLRVRAKLNTPGLSDGVIELWLNGEQVARYTNLDLRGSYTGKGWNMFRLAGLSGYAWSRTWQQYWDNVKVTTTK